MTSMVPNRRAERLRSRSRHFVISLTGFPLADILASSRLARTHTDILAPHPASRRCERIATRGKEDDVPQTGHDT